MKPYFPYHMHSDYSLLDSATDFREYVDLAKKYGYKAFGTTEHGKNLGWISKKLYCDEVGIKYVHGVEIYLTESLEEKVRDNYHTVLLARNYDGVKELNALISKSCDEDHFYYTNRISFDEFLGISDNIISTSACLASPLNRLPDTHPRYMELAKKYDYLEVQPHNCDDQIEFNKRLYALSQKIGTPLIAGTDTHSSSSYMSDCRAALLVSKRKSYGDEDTFDLSYKTREELEDMFKTQAALPEEVYIQAIENTNVLADSIEDFELDRTTKYPILYGTREKDAEKFEETVERMFNDKVEKGIIPAEQVEPFREAIAEEMRVFKKLHMEGFMLSMSELVSWCKQQGMAIGPARGSVGGSRIAYVTDIIDLDPETWHTVFSRFCNEDREEIGDIDIDVIESDRPAIFKYITERFGADKTARVASFGTLQAKGVIDEVGRCLSIRWSESHPANLFAASDNPYSLKKIDEIKKEFDIDEQKTKEKYPEIFYYFDGLMNTKVSQSVHPAGMVISPVSLPEEYGVFNKDNELCLMMDMDEAHEVGAAKYDFLVLKTIQVIRDTCNNIGIPYPKSHEINWFDPAVWNDILKSPGAIFQFESNFAFECLQKYKPQSLFDMSLVTACIRPSGSSYRDDLLARKPNHNPSEIIDNLLAENNGYLVYQEDVIKFLQQICGLSGSEADNIRRAIGRKDKDRLDKAMPSILNGYCQKSDKPREVAENEAKTFLQILEDSASYMFGYNHSIAYCMVGYLCAYYRYYYPIEFITAFLNNAANDADIKTGAALAKAYKIKMQLPKFGLAQSTYAFDKEKRIISKGAASIKYIGANLADELYELSKTKTYTSFVDLLYDMTTKTSADTRNIEVLIKVDYFSAFGNQRELLRIYDMFKYFKLGKMKQIKKEEVPNSPFGAEILKFSTGLTKRGAEASKYTITDLQGLMEACQRMIYNAHMDDLSVTLKSKNFYDIMGYDGYVTGKEEDRPLLFIKATYPLYRKRDNAQFGYSVLTRSIGSGIESRFTVYNNVFNKEPIEKGDIVRCISFEKDKQYFILRNYEHVYD